MIIPQATRAAGSEVKGASAVAENCTGEEAMGLSSTLRNWFEKDSVESINAAQDAAADAIHSGDFVLDTNSRRAYLRDQDLSLSSAEFDLLHFLLTHPRKMVTPQTLLLSHGAKGVRRAEFMSTLLSLRRKLDAAFGAAHYLRTEPCLFYSFNAGGRS
jgi:DNA-binding response OmpR family regulator